MAPLLLCAFGIVFVLLRISSGGVDVVPDSVGLILYAVGLWRLRSSSKLLTTAAVIGAVAAVLALADLVPRFVSSDIDALLAFLRTVAVALATILGATALRARARDFNHVIARAYAVTAVALAVGLFLFIGGWAVNPGDHSRAVALVGWGQLLTTVMLAAYVLVLLVSADRTWAQQVPREDSSR